MKQKETKTLSTEDDTLPVRPLDEGDVALLKTYGCGPYSSAIARLQNDIERHQQIVKDLAGVVKDDEGLLPPSKWDLVGDQQLMAEEATLMVAHCQKIIETEDNVEESEDIYNPSKPKKRTKYVVKITPNDVRYVVGLGDQVAPTDIEEGMRIGVSRTTLKIEVPLPSQVDASVSLMTVEDKPDITYDDLGGCREAKESLREVLETPLLHPERFARLGIDPPKGVLLYGAPGTGKTLAARAVANRTNACFIRVIGSELVQKYVGEGSRMVREIFKIARTKSACIVFFDEIDAIGGTRVAADEFSDNEVQRTMLQISSELDGFDARGNIKVLMATNRPDILDPALVRPGRIDRKIEFTMPDLEGRIEILNIHCRKMNVDRDVRFELIGRLCGPNTTGADLRSVCTEAGIFAIRSRRKSVSERDFLDSIAKVIKGYKKFSSTPKYMIFN